ncbi:prolipoprotein diacylglyceryl transferase [Candidatus Pelagibacter sp.]|nr:prolipoprotein diacylglyceryl transferase [Candidatus Pelagibacter sp.]
MFINNFDPVAFEVLSMEIRWYSLAYIVGILIGWFLSKKTLIKDTEIREKFDDYVTYVIFGIIIGGRLGYVLFYDLNYYTSNLTDIFKIWQGGMSFHGGLIGVIIASIWFSKKNNHNPFKYLDIIAIVSPIGIFFGRISNFINSELYGIETDLPWGVKFIQVDNLYRHPSQLYEALLEGILLFLILILIYSKTKYKTGMCSFIFLILYGAFRIFSEFFREPDLQIGYLFGPITMGIMLSVVMIVSGFFLIIKKNDR